MKRIISLALAVFLFTAFGTRVFADSNGFKNPGSFSNSKVSFGFETLDTVIIYNNELFDNPDFDSVWPGSDIYIPVYVLGASGQQDRVAAEKDIKENEVTLSYKAVVGDRYVDNVELVDGKKAKITALNAGIYAKIEVSDAYMGNGTTPINIKLVLSVKKLSYPETQIELDMDISNRLVIIDEDTAYAAQSPTHFRSLRGYGGPATFDFGGKVRYTTKVKKGTSYYLNLDRSEQQAITQKYPDAYLEFYNFAGDKDTFNAQGTLEIPIDRAKFTPKKAENAQVYVYEITRDTLKALDETILAFDSKKNLLTMKTSVLGNYVISNQPLLREIDDDTNSILYTGYATSSTAESAGSEAASQTGSRADSQPSLRSETGLANDNVNTGPAIAAANGSADNPETSDAGAAPAIAMMLSSGTAIAAITPRIKKKNPPT